ncbi:hypothetical protein V1519DRAFT_455882, partial [Lipomyces tetrasporus]
MSMAFNNIFGQDSEVDPANDAASSSDSPIQASHIRACTSCVRAKAKCSTSLDVGGKCERCHRMNKDCQPSPPVRKRRTVKRPTANKASKLEKKLDGLVTLLKSATQSAPGIINATSVNSPPEGAVPSSHDSASGSTAAGSVGVGYRDYTYNRPLPNRSGFPDSGFTPAASSSSGSTSVNLQPVFHPALELSPEDAESYLNKFRTDFVKHFPFIVIPPSMTAHQLRQGRPFLWICIMSAASSNSTQQIVLSNEIREILGRQAYVEGTRNMDLLLAVLVYAAWDRRHCFERPIIVSLVQLAIAILYDLGLDKPPSKDPALVLSYDLKGTRKPSRLFRSPTMEERRALLGCFLMSSISSSTFRKGDSLRWTAYSDECLRVIETQKEFASDILLVQLVKLHLISEKVIDIPWSSATAEVDHCMRPPVMFYLKSLEAQLHDFKSNIPGELTDNKTLLMELYNTELNIHEIGLLQAPNSLRGQHNWLLECLFAYLNATKSWIDIFLSILPAQYVGFSAAIYTNMAHCFIGIYRLSTFEHPEWDRGLVRENLDVSLFLEQVEKNFAQVKEAAGLDLGGSEDIDSFNNFASRIKIIKMWWNARTVSTMAPHDTASGDVMGDFPMEFLDDDWLRDLLGPWN